MVDTDNEEYSPTIWWTYLMIACGIIDQIKILIENNNDNKNNVKWGDEIYNKVWPSVEVILVILVVEMRRLLIWKTPPGVHGS